MSASLLRRSTATLAAATGLLASITVTENALAAKCPGITYAPHGTIGSTAIRNLETRHISCTTAKKSLVRAYRGRSKPPETLRIGTSKLHCSRKRIGRDEGELSEWRVNCSTGKLRVRWTGSYGI